MAATREFYTRGSQGEVEINHIFDPMTAELLDEQRKKLATEVVYLTMRKVGAGTPYTARLGVLSIINNNEQMIEFPVSLNAQAKLIGCDTVNATTTDTFPKPGYEYGTILSVSVVLAYAYTQSEIKRLAVENELARYKANELARKFMGTARNSSAAQSAPSQVQVPLPVLPQQQQQDAQGMGLAPAAPNNNNNNEAVLLAILAKLADVKEKKTVSLRPLGTTYNVADTEMWDQYLHEEADITPLLSHIHHHYGFPRDHELPFVEELRGAMLGAINTNFSQHTKDVLHNAFIKYRTVRTAGVANVAAVLAKLAAPNTDDIGKAIGAAVTKINTPAKSSHNNKPTSRPKYQGMQRGAGLAASGGKACYTCGSEDHIAKNCPKAKNSGGSH